MFFITFPLLWSFSFFFFLTYVVIIFSIIFYTIPSLQEIIKYSKFKKSCNFSYLSGFDLYWIFFSFLFFFLLSNFSWVSPAVSSWFGNLIFSGFQYKFSFLILFIFYCIITLYSTSFYFYSKELYDYIIVNFNFFFWIYFLFLSNTLFTFIFFIEILSTLIFLLLITSTFSTTFFYNNLNLNLYNYFNHSMPFFFVQTFIYFFWISLISSLNLFFFLILFYTKFLTFDWFFFEFIFFYIINMSCLRDIFFFMFVWFNLLFCVFLKCGLVPFYFWKPTFFKGISFHSLLFYISFFYFFILLFFINFLLIYCNEIFFFFIILNIFLLISGILILFFILCESFYIKSFLALSSILNTLFVFLALNSVNLIDTLLWL